MAVARLDPSRAQRALSLEIDAPAVFAGRLTSVGAIEAPLTGVQLYIQWGYAVLEWDPAKERTNRAKHGVAFADATEVFEDARAITQAVLDFARVRSRPNHLGPQSNAVRVEGVEDG